MMCTSMSTNLVLHPGLKHGLRITLSDAGKGVVSDKVQHLHSLQMTTLADRAIAPTMATSATCLLSWHSSQIGRGMSGGTLPVSVPGGMQGLWIIIW